MSTGRVAWYDPQRGCGFITPDDGGENVFVHATSLEAAGLACLSTGQKVSYELSDDSRDAHVTFLSIG